ncbi:MAG: hypothetical protein NZ602_14800 [Thermoguttaceae bacterium]|nr:hypothetical protein [Thermoguttaceae bacterium]
MHGECFEQQNGQKMFASLGLDQHRESTWRHELLPNHELTDALGRSNAAGGTVLSARRVAGPREPSR